MKPKALCGSLALTTLLVFGLAGCGGGNQAQTSRPAVVDDLSSWLAQAGECENVETQVSRLPVPPARTADLAPAIERFAGQAVVGAIVICGGLNGSISYARFPSVSARESAVRESEGLISNELFCVKGPELIINDLLGYDNTAGFCRELGFAIHKPTHVFTSSQKHRHHLEAIAARLYAGSEGFPLPNVYCESRNGQLEFMCQNMVGGEAAEITLTEKGGRFAIQGPHPGP
jgi:hypothetical protein